MSLFPFKYLADLVDLRSGYQIRSKVEDQPGASHHLIQIRDFSDDRLSFDSSGLTRIEPGGKIGDSQILNDGDILFLSRSRNLFAYVLHDLPPNTLASSYFFIIRPAKKNELLPKYLSWFLNLPETIHKILRLSSLGANMPVVRREILEKLKIPLPPLTVQKSIIHITELAQRQQELLSELAQKKLTLSTAACLKAAKTNLTK